MKINDKAFDELMANLSAEKQVEVYKAMLEDKEARNELLDKIKDDAVTVRKKATSATETGRKKMKSLFNKLPKVKVVVEKPVKEEE